MRLAAADAANTYSGNVVLSSAGAASINVATGNGVVSALVAPAISYGSMHIYQVGTPITQLAPSNTGGAVAAFGYSSSASIYSAGVYFPNQMVFDKAGNLYVADIPSNSLLKIPVGGGAPAHISVGSGSNDIFSVTADTTGNIFAAEYPLQYITKIPADGSGNVRLFDESATGILYSVYSLAVDNAGNIFGQSSGSTAIYPAGGNTHTTYATGFNNADNAVTDAAGNLYVADSGNGAIKKVPAGGGSPITLASGFNRNTGLALDGGGNFFVAEATGGKIKEVPASGGSPITLASGIHIPETVAVDGAGNIYYAAQFGNLMKIKPVGGYAITPNLPPGLSFDSNTGIISGTPTTVDPVKNYTITAYNQSVMSTATVAIGVSLPSTNIVSIEPISVPNFTNTATIKFIATFGAPVTGLTANNFSLLTSGSISGASVVSVTVSGVTDTVTVNTGTGDGNIVIELANATGLSYAISNSLPFVGNQYIIDKTLPTINAINPFVFGNGEIDFKVSYNDANSVAAMLNNTNVTLNTTGSATGTLTVAAPDGSLAGVATITGISGTGTLSITVAPGGAADIAGNLAPGGTSSTYTVVVLPAISYNGPQSYVMSTAITPLLPANSGGAVPAAAYGGAVSYASGFDSPRGLATDAAGNLYVTDRNVNKVFKIPAGGGTPVSIGSGFNSPSGITTDADGNVYVSDAGNNAVKEILASDGSTIIRATGLSGPDGLTVDNAGNLYVACVVESVIRKIPAGSNTTVVVGSGFTNPHGVAADAAGNVYVADFGNRAIKKIPTDGGATITIATGLRGTFDITGPTDVKVDDAGNIFVALPGSNPVAEIPAAGGGLINIGFGYSSRSGTGYLALDKSGNLYITDITIHQVNRYNLVGGYYVSPSLPAGLSLDRTTGAITGTPTALSPAADYQIAAYNGAGGDRVTVNIAVVNLAPVISKTGTLSALTTTYGTSSSTGTFNVSATNTTAGVLVTPPPGFEVSASQASGFGRVVTIGSSGNIASTPVYIRLAAATAAGSYSGNVVLSTPGATSVNVATAASTVNKAAITITANNVTKTYGTSLGGSASATAFTVTGSLKNGNTISSVTVTYGIGAAAARNANTYAGSVAPSAAVGANGFLSSNYNITYVNSNIIINKAPITITANNVTKPFGVSISNYSGSTAFAITGNLKNGNTISSVTIVYGAGGAASRAIGTYTSSVTPSAAIGENGFLTANYAISYAKGNIIVVQPVISVSGNLTALSTMRGTPSAPASFNLSGVNLAAGIRVTPPSGFEVSADDITYSTTLAIAPATANTPVPVYVRLKATNTVGNYSGNVVLSSINAISVSKTISRSVVNPLLPLPTIQAQQVIFANTTTTSTNISWTNGNGAGRVAFIKLISNGSSLPANGTLYTASTTYGYGTQIGNTGWYCIYNGTGSGVNISGLSPGATYRVTVLEYNGTLGDAAYLEVNPPPGAPNFIQARLSPANVTTQSMYPVIPARLVMFSNTTTTSTTATWTNGDGTARAVFMELTGTGSVVLTEGTTCIASTSFGAGTTVIMSGKPFYCVYNGTGNSVNITGLAPNTLYRLTVVEYKGTAGNEKYLNTGQSPGNMTTSAPPLNALIVPKAQSGSAVPMILTSGNEKVEANNILSPNDDGINDIWVIKNIAFYPDNTVTVYNRAGEIVFTKKGYANDWDGTYRSSVLSEGTYYYRIDLGNGKIVKGFITAVGSR